MSAQVLDGKTLAAQTEAELLARVEQLKEKSGAKTPILATILVGDGAGAGGRARHCPSGGARSRRSRDGPSGSAWRRRSPWSAV